MKSPEYAEWLHMKDECGDCGSTQSDIDVLNSVRALDHWADAKRLPTPEPRPNFSNGGYVLFIEGKEFQGNSREAVRGAAAKWLLSQPDSVPVSSSCDECQYPLTAHANHCSKRDPLVVWVPDTLRRVVEGQGGSKKS